jgi:hypothetical protein
MPAPQPEKLLAQAGEIVTCTNGHEIAVVKPPGLSRKTKASPNQFDWKIAKPVDAVILPCPICRARYIQAGPRGIGLIIHINGEWRGG